MVPGKRWLSFIVDERRNCYFIREPDCVQHESENEEKTEEGERTPPRTRHKRECHDHRNIEMKNYSMPPKQVVLPENTQTRSQARWYRVVRSRTLTDPGSWPVHWAKFLRLALIPFAWWAWPIAAATTPNIAQEVRMMRMLLAA